jgi:prephenate dehydratase
LEEGNIDLGVVPIENFLAGSIVQTYDLLLEYNFNIVGEIFLQIHHNLIANKGAKFEDIKEVYSHPQALAQCKDFISENNLIVKEAYDTAGSVKTLKKKGDLNKSAIASEVSAEIYEMEILRRNIESIKNNTTRFIVISKDEIKHKNPDEKYLTSIIFSVSDVPAALYKCLGGFATNGVNLTKIESRPMKGQIGNYFFLY